MKQYEELSKRQLIDTIHGNQSEIDRLQDELNAIADAPTRFVIRELREEVQRQMNIARQRAKRFDEVLDNLKDGDVRELCEKLSKQVQENARIEELRVQQQDYVIEVKKRNKELEYQLDQTKQKLKSERNKRKEVAATLASTRQKIESDGKDTVTVFPTKGEIRAAYKLNVSVRTLREWVEEGVGPQPPYEDIESWQAWVEAHSSSQTT